MGVDREGWCVESVDEDDARGFAADARECGQSFERVGDFAVVFFEEDFRGGDEVFGFLVVVTAGIDDFT